MCKYVYINVWVYIYMYATMWRCVSRVQIALARSMSQFVLQSVAVLRSVSQCVAVLVGLCCKRDLAIQGSDELWLPHRGGYSRSPKRVLWVSNPPLAALFYSPGRLSQTKYLVRCVYMICKHVYIYMYIHIYIYKYIYTYIYTLTKSTTVHTTSGLQKKFELVCERPLQTIRLFSKRGLAVLGSYSSLPLHMGPTSICGRPHKIIGLLCRI